MTRGLCGRITIGDDSFERLINGETLTLDVRPDTVKVQLRLRDDSKYLSDLASEIQRALRRAPLRP